MKAWLKHIRHLLSDQEVLAGYDQVAELYPHVPSLSMWRAWEYAAYQGRILQEPVLDVGCGDGRWFQLIWPDVADVYGVDLEPAVVERAIDSGVYRHVWQADAVSMPVEAGMFGTVFANCSLEHMDNIHTIFSNIWDALRPGGLLIFSIVTDKINDWFSPTVLARALGEDAQANGLYDAWLGYHHLVNPFPIEQWCEGLVTCGFEVTEHIPIIPEMTGRLFLLIDGLWHVENSTGEIGDQLSSYLQQLPQFPTAFRGILQSALMMESKPEIGCGAVLVAKKVSMVAHPDRQCWCGNQQLAPFSSEYLLCEQCGTLVSQAQQSAEPTVARDDSDDYYGKEYWLSHQREDLGLPDIYARARTDLPERGLYWLRALLGYKLPPAQVLELGSSHGGFTALLRWAGFDATGLELSPWVVDFARATFDVPMLLGAVEDQQIAAGSLDAIVLMDVLEHLPDPLGTMHHCLSLLKPDGLLLIQTPQYPAPASFAVLLAEDSRFPEMMVPLEHPYLFSRQAVTQLFQQIGAEYIAFEPALFSHYDMFFAVSRQPLVAQDSQAIEQALSSSASGRMVQALLDEAHAKHKLEQRFVVAEHDRTARYAHIQQLEQQLAESDRDRSARLAVIETQGQQLALLDQQHQEAHGQFDQLRMQIDSLHQQAEEARLLQTDQQQQIEQLNAERTALSRDLNTLHARWDALQSTLVGLRSSRIYRGIRGLGRWGWLEQALDTALPPVAPKPARLDQRSRGSATVAPTLQRIVVDLTPVLPGGENGGAKLMTIELLKQLSQLAPECEFILLTSARSHAELALLDRPNMRRLCVQQEQPAGPPARLARLRGKAIRRLSRVLPAPAIAQLRTVYRKAFRRALPAGLLQQLAADVVFCPFTAPLFFDPTVPIVAVVYDLQYLYYPQFFSAEDRAQRAKHFAELCRVSSSIICISDYVRDTVLQHMPLDPARVQSIHIQLPHRLTHPLEAQVPQTLGRLHVQRDQYLLFPANFWLHKNHRMLLTAFGMYRARHPESALKLVCTGSALAALAALRGAVQDMGLGDWVVFPGYLPDADMAALFEACYAVIFPSLYEGFGMPVLEALAFGKPVLCSNVTSLPEIAGDAALYFDPRKPEEIVGAIDSLVQQPELAAQLVQRGRQRLAVFDQPAAMGRQYLQVLRAAVEQASDFADGIHGIFPDGWTGEHIVITFGASAQQRTLHITLTLPDWVPQGQVLVQLTQPGRQSVDTQQIQAGKTFTLTRALPFESGYVDLHIDPVFQPQALGLNADERSLGCICQACRISSADGDRDLLAAS